MGKVCNLCIADMSVRNLREIFDPLFDRLELFRRHVRNGRKAFEVTKIADAGKSAA